MADYHDYCEAFVRDADRDRFLATLFAPEKYRHSLFALYAFDIELQRTHHVKEPMAGEIRLQWWSDVVTGQGHSGGSPVATALIEAMTAFSLPEEHIVGLIDAHREALYPSEKPIPKAAEDSASLLNGPVFELAARILNDGGDPGTAVLGRAAGAAYGLAKDRSQAIGARAHLANARAQIEQMPEHLWPAFLHLALVPSLLKRDRIGQWRVQWVLWRASRHLPRALEVQ